MMMTKKLGLSILILLVAVTVSAAKIDRIEFKPAVISGKGESVIEIRGTGLRSFVSESKKDPHELVLTFDDASVSTEANQTIDATSFKSNVMQVAAYPLSGAVSQARVVVDFKKDAHYSMDESDQKLTIRVTEGQSAVAAKAFPVETTSVQTISSIAEEEPIDTASKASEKQFTGSPITLKLKDADVHEVLRLISDASGFNIVIHPSVSGRLTLQLERVPWDQALEVVLTTLKLAADRSQSVLRVMPREMLISEKQAELEAKKLSLSTAPRVTRIFPISYADLSQLSAILSSFANSQNSGPGSSGIPATIIVDQNTQSLIVRDTADNVERIRKMISLLDVQTPQVLIEGKVIEASNDFTKSISGNLGATGTQLGGAFNGATALVGNTRISSIAGTAGGGSIAGVSGLTIFDRPIFLTALLSIAEKDSRAKVVSSPRTVVLSGKSATITQTKSIGVQSTSTINTTTTTSISAINAVTKLNVTPRVTNDGSVFMKLDLSRDVLNQSVPDRPVVEPRNMTTEVIVDSGSTLVIGGILNLDETHVSQGIPFLRKVPLFGWLFGSDSTTNFRNEVMFFVTPRVLNPRKQGARIDEDAPPPVDKL